jgi:hypothetical protein
VGTYPSSYGSYSTYGGYGDSGYSAYGGGYTTCTGGAVYTGSGCAPATTADPTQLTAQKGGARFFGPLSAGCKVRVKEGMGCCLRKLL